MEKADIIIVGAGLIGLAVATALSRKDRNIIVLEKDQTFGQGASSRNSTSSAASRGNPDEWENRSGQSTPEARFRN